MLAKSRTSTLLSWRNNENEQKCRAVVMRNYETWEDMCRHVCLNLESSPCPWGLLDSCQPKKSWEASPSNIWRRQRVTVGCLYGFVWKWGTPEFSWISVELHSWGFLVGYRRVHPFWRTHHIRYGGYLCYLVSKFQIPMWSKLFLKGWWPRLDVPRI